MHAELTKNVANEAPSSIHEWRADWGASICLLSFGAGYEARYLSRRLAIDTRPLLAAIDRALVVFRDAHVLAAAAMGRPTTIDPASAISNPCLQRRRVSGRAVDSHNGGSCTRSVSSCSKVVHRPHPITSAARWHRWPAGERTGGRAILVISSALWPCMGLSTTVR